MPLDSKFGYPARVGQQDSLDSVLIVEPTLGLDVSHPSVNAPMGATPYSENYIIRDGGLEPRPVLALKNANPQLVDRVLGGAEVVSVTGIRYPFVSGSTRPIWYSNGSWSVLSYVSSYGINDPPAGINTNYYDVTQIYDAGNDENLAVFAHDGAPQRLFCWKSGATVYSTLTGSPAAKYVTAFNDYLVAFNIGTGGNFVQRVQWSDRGSNSSWTGGLSGFADLLDMRGQGTRIMAQENRLILFSEYEVWEGTNVAFPFVFTFDPVDRSVGCPYPWTAATTPAGIFFLASDFNVYLVSKFGGPAPVGGKTVQRYSRDNIDQQGRAWAVYDGTYNQYQLYFPNNRGSGFPQQALFLNVAEVQYSPLLSQVGQGAWALQTFDKTGGNLSLTRGFEANVTSSATSWGGMQAAALKWNDEALSWAQLGGASETRAMHIGSSTGTMYQFDSNATTDNGTAVRSIWRSPALFGYQPNRQKTMGRIRVDYISTSQSTVSFEASRNQGASFEPAVQLSLPANSYLSEAIAHVYASARYPMFQVSSEGERYRLFRFWLSVRAGGR